MVDKVSEMMVFEFELAPKRHGLRDVQRARYALADFLKKQGFAPGHWYANWKELEPKVWLIIGGSRQDSYDSRLFVKVDLRSAPPNVSAEEYQTDKVDLFKAYCEQKVKPMVIALLDKSKIPYSIVENK